LDRSRPLCFKFKDHILSNPGKKPSKPYKKTTYFI
jgi:hypothetical protein